MALKHRWVAFQAPLNVCLKTVAEKGLRVLDFKQVGWLSWSLKVMVPKEGNA